MERDVKQDNAEYIMYTIATTTNDGISIFVTGISIVIVAHSVDHNFIGLYRQHAHIGHCHVELILWWSRTNPICQSMPISSEAIRRRDWNKDSGAGDCSVDADTCCCNYWKSHPSCVLRYCRNDYVLHGWTNVGLRRAHCTCRTV